MRFLLIMWTDDGTVRGTDEDLQAWMDYQNEVTEAGVYVDSGQFTPPSDATVVTTTLTACEERPARNGPFVGGDAQLAGYYLLDCPDAESAQGWARRAPLYGDVEVRALVEY